MKGRKQASDGVKGRSHVEEREGGDNDMERRDNVERGIYYEWVGE